MSKNVSNSAVTLNNGQPMPLLGLGTWQSPKGQVRQAVVDALAAGYRHLDCAYIYQNEDEIGEAITESIKNGVLEREQLFVTTKVWLTFYSRDRVVKCLRKSLKSLQLEYVDLYLVHWPMGFKDDDENLFPEGDNGNIAQNLDVDYTNTWLGMQDVLAMGLTKAIGVSNFTIEQLENLKKVATVTPAVNQIELHPYLIQTDLVNYCKANGIVLTAYSPLGSTPRSDGGGHSSGVHNRPAIMENQVVKDIAAKFNKTPAQILIRYHVQREIVCIPKSVTKERIIANSQVFDFELSPEDIQALDKLDCGYRVCSFDVQGLDTHRDYPFKKSVTA